MLRVISAGVAIALIAGSAIELSAQAPKAGPKDACAVLTAEDVAAATGLKGYGSGLMGDPPGQGAGGGSSCQYSGNPFAGAAAPLLSVVYIPAKDYVALERSSRLPQGCRRDAVRDVGDDAFFESCPSDSKARTAPLYVKVGKDALIVQLDVDDPFTPESARAAALAVAKAAADRLR